MPPPRRVPPGRAPEAGQTEAATGADNDAKTDAKTDAAGTPPERSPIPAPAAADQHTHPPPRQAGPDLSSSPYLRVSVATIPPDATAMLDDRPDSACTTPCALDATPGQHMVSISRQGYQTEHRPVTVANSAVQLPTVALRVPGGVLMLASTPRRRPHLREWHAVGPCYSGETATAARQIYHRDREGWPALLETSGDTKRDYQLREYCYGKVIYE